MSGGSYFKGYRQRMFNNMLSISSRALAVYRALEKLGKSSAEVWELCHTVLELPRAQIP